VSAEQKPFDVHRFDASLLNIPQLLAGVRDLHNTAEKDRLRLDEWTVERISHTPQRTIYRATPSDLSSFPKLAIKLYHKYKLPPAGREHNVLQALQDLGVSIGPRPFYADDKPDELPVPVLVAEWIDGQPLRRPPNLNDEGMWHRIMSLTGIVQDLPLMKLSSKIPMLGQGAQSAADMFRMIQNALEKLGETHPLYQNLQALFEQAQNKISDDWNMPAKVALSRLSVEPHHFIWDGHHLRGVGWDKIDWTDTAYGVAFLSAHPAYEELPSSHWVWFRWEYARLTNDETLIARATVYTHLLWLFWAIDRAYHADTSADAGDKKRLSSQGERYLKRVQQALKG
jgi:hypothetical protein